jgi:GAG-pre-integrase domain
MENRELGEATSTNTLLEKLTQIMMLQQNTLNQLIPNTSSSQPSPASSVVSLTDGPSQPISEKLTGENYSLWSQVVRLYVKGRDKMKHLTGDPAPPQSTEPTYQKWDTDDSVVKGWLINSLDPRLRANFIRYPTAKEVWDAISTTFYDGHDEVQVYNLNKKVTRLKQSGRMIEEYYNELQGLWQEINFRCPNPMVCAVDITKFNEFVEKNRVYTFLDGLDDRLDSVRAVVLQISPFSTVEQAYAVVRREISRQVVMLRGEEEMRSSMAMVQKGYKQPEVNFVANKSLSKQEKARLKCINCGMTGHVKEGCYKIIGYPDWWNERKMKSKIDNYKGKGSANITTAGGIHMGQTESNLLCMLNTQNQGSQPPMNHNMNMDQNWVTTTSASRTWNNLDGLPGSARTNPTQASISGPGQAQLVRTTDLISPASAADVKGKGVSQGMCLISEANLNEWVIDSGATDHMTFSKKDLNNIREPSRTGILNANGVSSQVESTGDVHVSNTLTLNNTLHVPSLSTKLLYVGQITEELNCVVLMFPNFCIFQDILTKEIIGRGIKRGRLYHLKELKTGKANMVVGSSDAEKQIWTWHRRLGHPSFSYMRNLLPSLFSGLDVSSFVCQTCIKAKSHRVPYHIIIKAKLHLI